MEGHAFENQLETPGVRNMPASREKPSNPGQASRSSRFYRAVGNQALNRLVQSAHPKAENGADHSNHQDRRSEESPISILPILRQQYGISEPDDPIEREASSVASQIVNMQAHQNQGFEAAGAEAVDVWRHPDIRRQAENSPGTHQTVNLDLPTSDGARLEQSVAAYMEPRFGYSFKDVRIHTSPQSADLSGDLNARAFTVGKDIYFGHGEYNPQTQDGKKLIAHELTHVVQQRQATQIEKSTVARTKAPLAEKTLTVNVTYLHGGSTSLSSHLTYANTVYSQAKVKIVKGKEVTLDETKTKAALGANKDLDLDSGYPTTASTDQTNLLKENRVSGELTMYYVKDISHPLVSGILGCSWWPATSQPEGFAFGAASPDRTWPHELGHVLLDDGGHPSDNDNFMAQTSVATGKDTMTSTQISTIRGNSHVK